MRISSAWLLFVGGMLVATGYGATFILDRHFKSFGSNEVDTGSILFLAMLGSFIGVAIVGSFSRIAGAANLAATGGLAVSAGFAVLATSTGVTGTSMLGGFAIGIGWGMFYLAAPMALSQRTTRSDRGYWFTRFAAFQMAGIGLSPYIAGLVLDQLQRSTSEFFLGVSISCVAAFVFLALFERREPKIESSASVTRWAQALPGILATPARYPIVMVALGACVFSGLMTFQSSLVANTDLQAGTFFAAYGLTVVFARLLFAVKVNAYPASFSVPVLLIAMITGSVLVFAYPLGISAQAGAAVLLGIGYGLVYPLLQAQAVNDVTEATYQDAILTWFVLSYFVGIFGFPLVGSLLIVSCGIPFFLALVVGLGCAELACSILGNRFRRARQVSD